MSPSWLFLSKGESGNPLEHMCDVQLIHCQCRYSFWCNVQLKPLQPVSISGNCIYARQERKVSMAYQYMQSWYTCQSRILQMEIADPDMSFGTAHAHEWTPRCIKVAEIWQPRWGVTPWQSRANFALFAATAFVGYVTYSPLTIFSTSLCCHRGGSIHPWGKKTFGYMQFFFSFMSGMS